MSVQIELFVHDRYGHDLKKSIPTGQLVHFYSNTKRNNIPIEECSDVGNDDTLLMSTESQSDANACQCTHAFKTSKCKPPLTSTLIKSQIVIMSSQEMPVSSDDSKTIDVLNVKESQDFTNPWGNMNDDQIPIVLVSKLNDTENSCEIVDVENGTPTKFKPLNPHEQKVAALKFFLVINETTHVVNYYGIGNVFPNPPIITQSALGNGAYFFNSFSILLNGQDSYNTTI